MIFRGLLSDSKGWFYNLLTGYDDYKYFYFEKFIRFCTDYKISPQILNGICIAESDYEMDGLFQLYGYDTFSILDLFCEIYTQNWAAVEYISGNKNVTDDFPQLRDRGCFCIDLEYYKKFKRILNNMEKYIIKLIQNDRSEVNYWLANTYLATKFLYTKYFIESGFYLYYK